jgi:hypothetical protein
MFLLSTLLFGCGEEEITRFEELEYDNLPPYSAIIDLEPALPITTDDLEALIVAESTDPNGEDVTLSFMWYKNDELQTDLTEATVSSDLTEVGQVWTVAVVATDGTLSSAESRRSVTIRNSTPTVTASLQWIDGAGNVVEDLDAPGVDAMLSDFGGYALQVVAEGTDIDETDELTFAYSWSVDGADAGVEEDILESDAMDRGQDWVVTVTANDGLTDSEPVELSFSFYNAVPVIDSVSVMPEMPALGDSVECMATATDEDDTELTFEYTWTITNAELDEDGNSVTSESSDNPFDTGTLVEGDSIVCSAVASDGRDSSEAMMSDSVTLAVNTAPMVSDVLITDPAVVGDTLTCSATISDAESAIDDLTVSYEWTDASGAVLDSTDMLDTSALNEGDVVTCTVTADDGNMQASASADATLITNE